MLFRAVAISSALLLGVSPLPAAAEENREDPLTLEDTGDKPRQWSYEAGLDLLGREGNVREFGLGINLGATLSGTDDTLKLVGELENRKSDGEQTADSVMGSLDYEAFFSERVGWYFRTALERDKVELVDLRSTSSVGLSYRIFKQEDHSLVFRAGLGYRYTEYEGPHEDDSDPTLDLGLFHRYTLDQRLKWLNELTYSPNLSEMAADYRLIHESSLEMPVGLGDFWSLRTGVRNEYDSRPAGEKRLDTSYFMRLILKWGE